MLRKHSIVCVLPAYNAARTLERTLRQVPPGLVDRFVLVDDASTDETVKLAQRLSTSFPLEIIQHSENRGYGANQKTCYASALTGPGDIVVMLHPDGQYDPRLLGAMCEMVSSGVYDVVLGSRMLSPGPLAGGMPLYKYLANRFLTIFENLLLGMRLSEYHTGYRAYTRATLEKIDFTQLSDGFVFDNQIILQAHLMRLRFGEISVPAHYFPEASSISFSESVRYGLGVVSTSLRGGFRRWR